MKKILPGLLVLFAACGQDIIEPYVVNELDSGTDALHIIVSNQSFSIDPINMDIYVDDVHIITGDFEVGSQHNFIDFDFLIDGGSHTFEAFAPDHNVHLTETFMVQDETWGVLMFWYYTADESSDGGVPKKFAFDVFDYAPAFE